MGHVKPGENGVGGIERRKGALVSRGAERGLAGLDRSRTAAATLVHPLPGASSLPPRSRGAWHSGEKMHKENIFDVTVNVF